eukprot:318535_1
MAANPEFGDSENIFGADLSNATKAEDRVSAIMNAAGAQGMSHIVDFDKYIVSVKETDGNVTNAISSNLNQMEDSSSSSSSEEDVEAKREVEEDPFSPLKQDPFADMVSMNVTQW